MLNQSTLSVSDVLLWFWIWLCSGPFTGCRCQLAADHQLVNTGLSVNCKEEPCLFSVSAQKWTLHSLCSGWWCITSKCSSRRPQTDSFIWWDYQRHGIITVVFNLGNAKFLLPADHITLPRQVCCKCFFTKHYWSLPCESLSNFTKGKIKQLIHEMLSGVQNFELVCRINNVMQYSEIKSEQNHTKQSNTHDDTAVW